MTSVAPSHKIKTFKIKRNRCFQDFLNSERPYAKDFSDKSQIPLINLLTMSLGQRLDGFTFNDIFNHGDDNRLFELPSSHDSSFSKGL